MEVPYGFRTAQERVETFDEFRESLSPEWQVKLDRMLENILENAKKRRSGFGPAQAKELLMALAYFYNERELLKARWRRHRWE